MKGDEIRKARERAGLTQTELAARIRVHQRTVSNWERGATVPRNRLTMLERVLSEHDDESTGEREQPAPRRPSLTDASDVELLAEIARRFSRTTAKEAGDGDELDPAPMNEGERGSSTVTDLGGERRRRDDWAFGHRVRGDLGVPPVPEVYAAYESPSEGKARWEEDQARGEESQLPPEDDE